MVVLRRLLLIGLSLILSIAAIAGGLGFSHKTVDDSTALFYENAQTSGNVLGAKNEKTTTFDSNICPESKPVIGWIDYRGNKLIKENLEENQSPSGCFINIEHAKEAGFN